MGDSCGSVVGAVGWGVDDESCKERMFVGECACLEVAEWQDGWMLDNGDPGMDLISVDIKAQMEGSRKCTELE